MDRLSDRAVENAGGGWPETCDIGDGTKIVSSRDERAARQDRIADRAAVVLGDGAYRWLVDPHPDCNGSPPYVVAARSESEAQHVERLLDALAQNVTDGRSP